MESNLLKCVVPVSGRKTGSVYEICLELQRGQVMKIKNNRKK